MRFVFFIVVGDRGKAKGAVVDHEEGSVVVEAGRRNVSSSRRGGGVGNSDAANGNVSSLLLLDSARSRRNSNSSGISISISIYSSASHRAPSLFGGWLGTRWAAWLTLVLLKALF
jgi:hypothetical protein